MSRYWARMRVTYFIIAIIQILFGLWVSSRFPNSLTPIVPPMPRDSTCKKHDCHKHGTCLLGKCFCRPGYEGIDCEINLNQSTAAESCANNDRCFFHPLYGIGEVSLERWEAAASAELSVWATHRGFNDRWKDHLAGFDNYKMLPNDLGNMIEMGCGPYTQTLSILRLRNKHVNIRKLTLSDPNANEYMNQVKQCSYKNGTLIGFNYIPTTIITLKSEEMLSYTDTFDTILMINVLEHVQNAYQILQNLYMALTVNGTLIFAERWWDQLYEKNNYKMDNIHPIRIKYYVWKWFTDHFIPLYDARNHESFLKYEYNGSYFIGRKITNPSF